MNERDELFVPTDDGDIGTNQKTYIWWFGNIFIEGFNKIVSNNDATIWVMHAEIFGEIMGMTSVGAGNYFKISENSVEDLIKDTDGVDIIDLRYHTHMEQQERVVS